MKSLKYNLAIFLTALQLFLLLIGIVTLIYGGLFWNYMYDNDKLNEAVTAQQVDRFVMTSRIVGGTLAVVGGITINPVARLRQRARVERKFDEYGRSKDISSYERLSVKEQEAR